MALRKNVSIVVANTEANFNLNDFQNLLIIYRFYYYNTYCTLCGIYLKVFIITYKKKHKIYYFDNVQLLAHTIYPYII